MEIINCQQFKIMFFKLFPFFSQGLPENLSMLKNKNATVGEVLHKDLKVPSLKLTPSIAAKLQENTTNLPENTTNLPETTTNASNDIASLLNENEVIASLALLSPMEYDRARKKQAKH